MAVCLLKKRKKWQGLAREKTTLAWMKSYARRYKEANEIPDELWVPERTNLSPPEDYMTTDHLENFVAYLWEIDESKPTVTQGRKYMNWFLTNSGRPPVNKYYRQHYRGVKYLLATTIQEIM